MIGFKQHFAAAIEEGFVKAEPSDFPNPKLVFFNQPFASTLKAEFPNTEEGLASLFSGKSLPEDAKPIAQAYAGHQFGHFNPQLGDGRAMILGELEGHDGLIHELDLKGSGATPFSRGGDGKAALGPMLREVLVSESMHALGIPTTRSLAVVSTGEIVYRNPPQPGAVLARTAQSHIRIGTFQFFAARKQQHVVQKLIDFCISRHYPQLSASSNSALALLDATVQAQAQLVAQWMGVGFVHGVMNTDNMLISGETIDYGPCAFMDTYHPETVFSSIDQHSRYAYLNQPGVAQWNLSRFAETLLPLMDEEHDKAVEIATDSVRAFSQYYEDAFRQVMCDKLGLDITRDNADIDECIEQWHTLLQEQKQDWTLSHYYLSTFLNGHESPLLERFPNPNALSKWLDKRATLTSTVLTGMQNVNPCVIPRNHLVEDALNVASKGQFDLFERLLSQLKNPFKYPSQEAYTLPASQGFTDNFVTFCGT